jgi:hypothetical protein
MSIRRRRRHRMRPARLAQSVGRAAAAATTRASQLQLLQFVYLLELELGQAGGGAVSLRHFCANTSQSLNPVSYLLLTV